MIRIPPRNYDDIINLPRPESSRRTSLSTPGRAAQFAPFAALTGLEDELDETARRIELRPESGERDCLYAEEAVYDSCGQFTLIMHRVVGHLICS